MKKPEYKSKKVQEKEQKSYTRDNSSLPHFHSICSTAERELALICTEGDNRYGEFNWCFLEKTNKVIELKKDAIQHIKNHLNLYQLGDRAENHLAKIMWGCMAMIHHDSNCKHHETFKKGK